MPFRLLLALVGADAFAASFFFGDLALTQKQYGWTAFAAFLTAYVLAVRASRRHIIFLYLFYKEEHKPWDLGDLGNGVFVCSLMFALGLLMGM